LRFSNPYINHNVAFIIIVEYGNKGYEPTFRSVDICCIVDTGDNPTTMDAVGANAPHNRTRNDMMVADFCKSSDDI
jgi:hypothetical protein